MEKISIANKALQLEAYNLDSEFSYLVDQRVDSLELGNISEELKLIPKLFIYSHLSLNGETIGSKVYKLHFIENSNSHPYKRPSEKKLILLTIFRLLYPYLRNRKNVAQSQLEVLTTPMKLHWLNIENLLLTIRTLGIVNFFAFLHNGRYLNIAERLLQLTPAISDENYYASTSINRVQMDILNRELIWGELAKFLTIMIPYLKTDQSINKLRRIFGQSERKDSVFSQRIAEDYLNPNKCGICENQPFNPFTIGCKHVFCYYCIESRYLADQSIGYTCSKCNYATKDNSDIHRYKIYESLNDKQR